MSSSILLIGNITAPSAELLRKAAESSHILFDGLLPDEIVMNGNQLTCTNTSLRKPLLEYDVYFFRGLGTNAVRMQEVAKHLKFEHSKRVVEKCFPVSGFPEDKFVPVSQQGFYVIPEYIVVKYTDIVSKSDLVFPIVVKKIGPGSSKGKWVKRVENRNDLKAFMMMDKEADFIIQKLYTFDYDTRVLVVGDKVIGGFNRFRRAGENFLTTATGGRQEVAHLTESQKQAAIEATRLQGLEIAGVDMFAVGNQIYIIEVNASPQFKVFTKITSIDAAHHIVTYLSTSIN